MTTPTTVQGQIGALLREARTRRGWSLQNVADESGDRFPPVVVGSYERGDRAITATKLVALAGLYGVPPGSLLPDHSSDATLRALVYDELAEELKQRAARLRGDDEDAGEVGVL